MKIGINGRFLIHPYTGIGEYTINLLKHLASADKKNQYFIAVPKKVDFDFGPNFKVEVVREKKTVHPGIDKTWWEQIILPNYFFDKNADLVHYLYPSNPRFFSKIPEVVTVHDVIPWVLPEYRKKYLTKIYQYNVKKSVEKADLIITVSNKSKKDIVNEVNFNAERIFVIPNGVDKIFLEDIDPKKILIIKEKYKLKNPFFLYVGGFDKRKNVELLIKTYLKNIAPNYKIDLVLAGEKHLNSELYLDSKKYAADNKKLKGKIINTGFISKSELHALYKSCLAFINISKFEGFNLPLIEAANAECPIITSDIEIHREVIMDAAAFVPVNGNKKLADYMKKIYSDEKFRNSLKEKTQKIKDKYSWDKVAEETLSIYKIIWNR